MTPLIATFWRRRLITNTESTSTSHAVKRSGPNAPSGGDCDSTSGSGTFSTCHTSLNAQLPSESSSERKGFPSAKTYGTRPMKRAVSGSSSDRADATISDHSSISDINVDNTTRPPTMTSNDSSAGSPTSADRHSESTQVISSIHSLTSTQGGQSSRGTISSFSTTATTAEGQQPTSAATPTSILRNSDTISTSLATEDQRHTDSTSVTSQGLNSSGNHHGTSSVGLSTTQLTSTPSTSPTSLSNKNSSSDLDTSVFRTTTRTFSSVSPTLTLSAPTSSDSTETRTRGKSTHSALSSQTSVTTATSSRFSETSTHRPSAGQTNVNSSSDDIRSTTSPGASVTHSPSTTSSVTFPGGGKTEGSGSDGLGFGLSVPGLQLSMTAGKSDVGAGFTIGHPGSPDLIVTRSHTNGVPSTTTRSHTDGVPSTTFSNSGPTRTLHQGSTSSLPNPILGLSLGIGNHPQPTSSSTAHQSTISFPSSPTGSITNHHTSLGDSNKPQPTHSSDGDGSHPNSPSNVPSHTTPAATTQSGDGNGNGDGHGNGNGDSSATGTNPASSSPTRSLGSGDNNNGSGNGKGNNSDGSSTSIHPASSNLTHSSGNGNGKGDNSPTTTNPASSNPTRSSGSGDNNNSSGNTKGNSGDSSPPSTHSAVSSSTTATRPSPESGNKTSKEQPSSTVSSIPKNPNLSGHDAATPSPTSAQASSNSGVKDGSVSIKPTTTHPTATGSRVTAGVNSAVSATLTSIAKNGNSASVASLSASTDNLRTSVAPLDRVATSGATGLPSSRSPSRTTTSTLHSTVLITTTNAYGQQTTESSVEAIPTVITVPLPSTPTTNRKAIIGGIIGGIVIVLLAIGLCFFYRRRRRNRSRNFVPYLNLDGDRPPRASIAHDTEAPPSPIFNPMAMIASSSRATIPAQPSVVTRKPVPFYDVLNDENMTIKRTATFSRLSKNSYPRSSFSSQFTGAESSRYSSSSSSSSFITASDGDSTTSTVKVGELIDPFADPEPSVLMADDPFADHFGLREANIPTDIGGKNSFRILPPVPQLRVTKPSPSPNDESTRVSHTSLTSSHWGVAM